MIDYKLGADLSHWQVDNIDWKEMKGRGLSFVYLKITEGDYFTDPSFLPHYNGAFDVGMRIGVYHYVSPWNKYTRKYITGKANFDYFNKVYEQLVPNPSHMLRPAADVEAAFSLSDKEVTTCVQTFVQNLGYPNLMYSADWFWYDHVLPWSGWKKSDLWVSSPPYYDYKHKTQYPNHELFLEWLDKTDTKFPIIPRATDNKESWDTWGIWQFSHKGDGKYYGLERGDLDLLIAKPDLFGALPEPEPIPEPLPIVDPQPVQASADLAVQVGDKTYSGKAELK